jgi:hypothetical protein
MGPHLLSPLPYIEGGTAEFYSSCRMQKKHYIHVILTSNLVQDKNGAIQ